VRGGIASSIGDEREEQWDGEAFARISKRFDKSEARCVRVFSASFSNQRTIAAGKNHARGCTPDSSAG